MSELLKILSKKIINERSWAFIIHQNEEKNILKMKRINAHNFFSKTNLYHECIISGYINECAYNAIA